MIVLIQQIALRHVAVTATSFRHFTTASIVIAVWQSENFLPTPPKLGFADQLIGSYPPTVPAPLSSLNPLDTTGNSCHNLGTMCYGDASQYW